MALTASSALAQTGDGPAWIDPRVHGDGAPPGVNEPRRVVEQGFDDRGPLSRGLRLIFPGLHQPGSFERVETIPGRSDLFMRIAGGVYAVFPRSMYVSTRQGDVAMIPDGVTFYIGPPPFLDDAPVPTAPRRVDEAMMLPPSAGTKVITVETPNAASSAPRNESPSAPHPSIAEPTAYRASRLQELMRRAAQADQPRDAARP